MATRVAMAMSLFSPIPTNQTLPFRTTTRSLSFSIRAQEGNGGGNFRRVWRRRKLRKEDWKAVDWETHEPRHLFLEEHVNKMKQEDKHICAHIDMLFIHANMSKFDFVNEMVYEMRKLVIKDPEAYYSGAKKAYLHALTNRLKEMGYDVAEAYLEPGPYDPPKPEKKDTVVPKRRF